MSRLDFTKNVEKLSHNIIFRAAEDETTDDYKKRLNNTLKKAYNLNKNVEEIDIVFEAIERFGKNAERAVYNCNMPLQFVLAFPELMDYFAYDINYYRIYKQIYDGIIREIDKYVVKYIDGTKLRAENIDKLNNNMDFVKEKILLFVNKVINKSSLKDTKHAFIFLEELDDFLEALILSRFANKLSIVEHNKQNNNQFVRDSITKMIKNRCSLHEHVRISNR